MVMPSPRPTAAALRQRIYRKRRQTRVQCFSVELLPSEIDGLISKGYLDDKARHNRRAVQRALESYVCDLVPFEECSDAYLWSRFFVVVRAVPADALSFAGLAVHGPRNAVDKVFKGATLHP